MPRDGDGFDAEEAVREARQHRFDHVRAQAEALTKDATPEDIDAVVAEAAAFSATAERQIHNIVKQRTGLPFSVLKAAKAQASDDDEGSDHLVLARSIVENIGADNIIGTSAHLWTYDGTIWEPLEPRGERHLVQSHLGDQAERPVTKGLVDSVADVLRNDVYRPNHAFNVGPEDAIPTPNGELTLANDGTWRLDPHCREHYRTTRVPVEYDPTADCPRFRQFLDEVFASDPDKDDKARVVLELIGYSLVAHTRYERFVILVGEGSNGKSVLLSIVEAVIGSENVSGVQPHQMDRTFQRAHLHRKLANIVTEIRQGEVIADAELKSITSGESTTVEHKFRDPFVLSPFATCWFGTNHLPATRDFSDALFRRAVILEFNRKFEDDGDKDPYLKQKLRAELPGILNAALAAYANVVTTGKFTEPQSSLDAKDQWRLESDQVQQFIEAKCENAPDGWVAVRRLYQSYREWAGDAGIKHTLTEKSFSQRICRLGYAKEKRGTGMGFCGVAIQSGTNDG